MTNSGDQDPLGGVPAAGSPGPRPPESEPWPERSVTRLLPGLRAGESGAVELLFARYYARLVRLAGKRLATRAQTEADEEDVAVSALHGFFAQARAGQFADLQGRKQVWRVLATLTVRKAIMQVRRQSRQKRGGGLALRRQAQPAASLALGDAEPAATGPSPATAAEQSEAVARRLDQLPDPVLRQIATLKLQGYSSIEIAAQLQVTPRTVDRKINLIRTIWQGSQP